MVFKKGQSGNPSGENGNALRKHRQIADLLTPHVDKAVNAIVAGLQSDDISERLVAAKDLLNRVYGMPKQPTEHSGDLFKGIKVIVERG